MDVSDWQKALVAEGELYRVGGAVRDELLGAPAPEPETDFLVRGIPPERLEAVLKARGTLVYVGKAFGVYKFAPEGAREVFDIVFPRTERSLGPGHREFDVRWDWKLPIEEDLRRRDFTINAIAQRVGDGALVDPLGGRGDLQRRLLRMIFPAAFREDPLRILRGARFATRFDLAIDPATQAAMKESVDLLATLSAERVQEELTKVLTQCPRVRPAFETMHRLGALARVLPELDRCAGVTQNEFHPDDVFVHSLETCDHVPRQNLALRWSALLHDVGKVDTKQTVREAESGERVVFYGHEFEGERIAERVLRRLRYHNALVRKCAHLVAHHMFHYTPEWKDATVRRFVGKVGRVHLDDLFALRRADATAKDPAATDTDVDELERRVERVLAENEAVAVSDLAVDGRDVMRVCGIPPGRAVGEILDELLGRVIEEPELNERTRLLGLLKTRRPRQK